MPYDVWLPGAVDPGFLECLRETLGAGVQLHLGAERPERVRAIVQGVPTQAHLSGASHLERVLIPYAGVPEATRALLAAHPHLTLHNLHHNAASTAELALALFLAAIKRVVPHDQELRRGDWRRRYAPPESMTAEGRHAVVIGFGAIGTRIARACSALGLTVSATRASVDVVTQEGGVDVHPARDLASLLPRAQVLFLCAPLTAATRGLMGASELALLPRDACVVNVGRGALIDEDPFYEALRDRRIDCAGLDVWYAYPRSEDERAATPPSAHPFHSLDNVVLSPHRAGLTRQNEVQRARALAALLRAAHAGQPVPNVVSCETGY